MTQRDKIVFVTACCLMVAGGFRTEWGVTWRCPWWHHLTFHFVHGNIFHLAGNILVLWLYCKGSVAKPSEWIAAFASATALSFAIPASNPLVGFSGIIMFVYGLLLVRLWGNRRVRQSLLLLAALSAVSLPFHQWPAVLFHALCIVAGVSYQHIQSIIHDTEEEAKRTDRRGDRA